MLWHTETVVAAGSVVQAATRAIVLRRYTTLEVERVQTT